MKQERRTMTVTVDKHSGNVIKDIVIAQQADQVTAIM